MASNIKEVFSRNKGLWIFLGVALVVAILLGVFISPFASSSPDGLERVAEDKGFLEVAEETDPAWEHSPMADYAVPGVESERASTGLSGLLGVLITVVVAVLIGVLVYLISGRRNRKQDTGTGTSVSET